MEIFVKEKFESLRDEWSNVLCYHDPQSAWLMFSMCLSRSISHMCRQRPPSIILKYAHTFDDNMRRAVRRIFKVQLSDTEWRRLKLPCNEGGCNIFDIYKVAIAGYVASYEECFKISSLTSTTSVPATTTLMTAFLAPSVSSTSIAHNLQEWPTNSPCFTSAPRECIKLQYPYNQILTSLASEEYRAEIRGKKDIEANLLHSCQEETHAFLRVIPYSTDHGP
jgi:hypothetical protein